MHLCVLNAHKANKHSGALHSRIARLYCISFIILLLYIILYYTEIIFIDVKILAHTYFLTLILVFCK